MTLQQLLARVRPSPDRLPRVVWLLVVGRAVNQLGAFTLPFLTIALTQHFGASIPTAGALMAVFGAATIASRLLGGWLADRIGRRGAIVAGLTLTAVAQVALAGAPSLAVAACAVAVLGLAFEIYEPPSQALIADVVPAPTRPAAYGLLAAALSGAAVAAGLLAAALAAVDVRLLFVIDAATCLSCAVLLRVALPAREPTSDSITEPDPTGDRIVAGSNPWRDPRLLALLGSGVVFASIYLQVSATLGLTLDQRGIPPTRVGLLFALSALTVVVGQPLLRRGPLARLDAWRAMAVGYALLGAGLLANGFASTLPQFAAATVLWSLGDLILLGRAYSLVADIAPEQSRARYFSVYGLCWGAAAVIGPFAGTQLLAHAGPGGLWTGCAIACGALAFAQPGLRRLVAGTNPI
jgi:MFS family permease